MIVVHLWDNEESSQFLNMKSIIKEIVVARGGNVIATGTDKVVLKYRAIDIDLYDVPFVQNLHSTILSISN